MPEYLEFNISVLPSEPDTYWVSADAGERGTALSTLHWKDLASLGVPAAPGTTHEPRAMGRPAEGRPTAPGSAHKALGEQLGAALFNGAVGKLWDRMKATSGDSGIRVRLVMDLSKTGMARIASLPWELLRLDGQEPLAINPLTPLVRSLVSVESAVPTARDGPIRVLVVTSLPAGLAPLDLEEECETLRITLRDNPDVEVQLKFLHADRGVSLRDRLLKALESARETPYHVLHYMGHGGFLENEVGALVFDDEQGRPDLVSGEVLAGILTGYLESFRLVVLNACDTAKAAGSPLSGVATALVQRGVAAVIAMQQPISDLSALKFSEHFYRCMAGPGRAIDVAVAEARKHLAYGGTGGVGAGEWATPVIYLQPRDGVVFPAPEADAVASDRGEGSDMPMVFVAAPSLTLRDLHTRVREALGTALKRHRVEYSDRRRAPDADTRAKIWKAGLCVHLLSDRRADTEPDAPGDSAAVLELKAVRTMGRPHLVIRPVNANEQGVTSERYTTLLEQLAGAERDDQETFEYWRMDQNEVVAAIRERLEGQSPAGAANAPAGSPAVVRVDAFRTDLVAARKLEDVLVGQNLNVTRNTSVDGTPDATCESIGQALYIVVEGSADNEWVTHRLNAAERALTRPGGPRYIGVYDCRGNTPKLRTHRNNTRDDPSAQQLVRNLEDGRPSRRARGRRAGPA